MTKEAQGGRWGGSLPPWGQIHRRALACFPKSVCAAGWEVRDKRTSPGPGGHLAF